jgi:hypothetical protein
MSDTELRPNEVPTEGPRVSGENVIGQNPYTDPPPLARQRFYEDPKPIADATEEQVLQGRGAPAYYPPDAPYPSRVWNPRRYPDQAETPRPADTPQPTDARAASMTVEQLVRLPDDEQQKILDSARESGGVAVPEFRPTQETIDAEDKAIEEGKQLDAAAHAAAYNPSGAGLAMAPATQGTITTSSADEPA